MKRRESGVTLVELMVALLIGLVAALVIQQVMALFEGVKRTSSAGADAQVNGAIALMTLERDIRQAGFGLFANNRLLCPLGVNIYYSGATISNGGNVLPVRIIDGGDGADAIELVYASTSFGAVPTIVVKNMPTPSSIVTADNPGGLREGQVFIVAGKDADKVCTLMQMSQDPQLTGNGWNLQHNSGAGFLYNPPNPSQAFATAPAYTIGDIVINLGSFVSRRYQIVNQRLQETNPITGANTPLVDQIVTLQAQYGLANAGSTQVVQWCNARADSACGNWSNPTANDIPRIRAVRIAVVARSTQYEREEVSPAALMLWANEGAGDPPPVFNLTADERHYRYKVYSTIVPLRNVIWGMAP
ncbi:MAG: PilW family protein [Rhodocyclaceae bacterium]|nr:PilW family protein [Rhodocyclaceae bacterium]